MYLRENCSERVVRLPSQYSLPYRSFFVAPSFPSFILMAFHKVCCKSFCCFTSPDGPEATAHSSSSGKGAFSSETAGTHAPALLKADGSSSSSIVPKVPDLPDGIRKDVNADAVEGKEVKVEKVVQVAVSSSTPSSSTLPKVSDLTQRIRKAVNAEAVEGREVMVEKVVQVAASSSTPSSSTVPKESDLTDAIRKDVNADAIDEKEVKVDLVRLMEHISALLEIIRKKKSPRQNLGAHNFWPTTSKGLLDIKEFFLAGKELASSIENIIPAKTIAVDLLKGIGHVSLATAGLLVVANILERFEDVSENKEECLSLLEEMNTLAKYVKQLQENSKLENQMDDSIRKATELIVEASILCCTQIKNSKFRRFFLTSVNKKELSEFKEELNRTYRNMHTQMDMCIFNAITRELRQVHRENPRYAVGIDEAVEKVIEFLDLESKEKAVAVVVHGLGGMGKTTLADAVYARMFAREQKVVYKYSMVRLFDDITSTPSAADIIKKQTDIFKDLRRGTKEEGEAMPDIRTFEHGQGEIGRLLEQETAFIYIDNVLRRDTVEQGKDALKQLLPNMRKAQKVRFLITARDADAVSMSLCQEHGLKPVYYPIETLPDMEAKKLFEEKLSDMGNRLTSEQKDELVKSCGKIPKLLTVVAGFISDSEESAEEAYETVMKEKKKQWKEGTFAGDIEDYVFAYKSLDKTLRDPFLDICSFFQGLDWETLSNVVGQLVLRRLEKRALVTKDTKSMTARVHDIILTIGREKAQGNRFRITSASEFQKFLNRKEDEEIKGISFTGCIDPFHINAETLDSMYSSLRVLQLGNFTEVKGKCKNIFKELVLFEAKISHLPFDVSKFKEFEELTYLSYKPEDIRDLSQMPSSLRHIEFRFDPKSMNSRAFQISSKCLKQISHLRALSLKYPQLERLPQELPTLSALQRLNLSSCGRLEALPSSLGELSSLRFLDLSYCRSLKDLPSSLGKLSALQKLNLTNCERLEALPGTLGKLSALQQLNLSWCERLEALPGSLGELSSLQQLDLPWCKRLEALPGSLGELSSLRLLNLSQCASLKDLPCDIGKLSSLAKLHLDGCKELCSLPESIGQLKSLESLMNLSGTGLKELPDGFCNLSFITSLCMKFSRSLKKLPESFGQLKYLEHLDLSSCEILEELCKEFSGLSSLRVLSLDSCKMLKKLPEDFHCLTSLELLSLHKCRKMEGKWMDSIVKIKTLQRVNIRESRMLEQRCEEIRRQGDQYPWSFAVLTGEGSKDYIPIKHLHSEFESILTNGRLSDLPPNTLLLVMYGGYQEFHGFPSSLIEEIIDDIQTNFEMIYFGNHFDNLPKKMADRILDHAPANSNAQSLFQRVLAATVEEDLRDIDSLMRRDFQMSVKIVSDEKGDKYLSGWELLSRRGSVSVEEFVIKKCGRYLKLKQLVETPRESNTELLRELFASGEEESSCLGFLKSDASGKVGVAELKGKTILLDIRPAIMGYDILLQSLKEMYVAEKERLDFEIITIAIMKQSTESDFLEQLSRQVPWLVLQNPERLTNVIEFFLVEDCAGWLQEWTDRNWDRWYPGIIRVIESNGTIAAYNPGVLRMVNTWGVEAYPFTEEKSKELKEKERHQMEAMSNLMLLFWHLGSLADQVKASMFKGKLICLYISPEGLTDSVKNALTNAFTELSHKLQIIYIPQFIEKFRGNLIFYTNQIWAHYTYLEKVEMPQEEIQGMCVLNLSEHEAMRFWARIFSLKECIDGMDDDDKQLDGIRKLLNSIDYNYSSTMAIMDEDGEFITTLEEDFLQRLCDENPKDKGKELMLQLIHGPKECRKETLVELEELQWGLKECID